MKFLFLFLFFGLLVLSDNVFGQEPEPIITEPSQILSLLRNMLEYASALLDDIFKFVSDTISSFSRHFSD